MAAQEKIKCKRQPSPVVPTVGLNPTAVRGSRVNGPPIVSPGAPVSHRGVGSVRADDPANFFLAPVDTTGQSTTTDERQNPQKFFLAPVDVAGQRNFADDRHSSNKNL